MYIFECQIEGKMQSSTFYKALSVLVKECVKEDQVDYRYILGISVIGSFIFGKENLLEIHFLKTMSLSPLQTFLWTLSFPNKEHFILMWPCRSAQQRAIYPTGKKHQTQRQDYKAHFLIMH